MSKMDADGLSGLKKQYWEAVRSYGGNSGTGNGAALRNAQIAYERACKAAGVDFYKHRSDGVDSIIAACDALERRVDAMEGARCDAAWRKDASPTEQLTGKRSNAEFFAQGRAAKGAGCKAGDCPYYAPSTAGEQWLKGLKS